MRLSFMQKSYPIRQDSGTNRRPSHPKVGGSGVLVLVAVVQVRIMRMLVHHPRVLVRVAMRLAGRIVRCMGVLVVGVVHVPVLMRERLMHVLVVMRLREMQIDPDPHQHRSTDEGQGRRLAEQRERQSSTDEGGRREISAGASSSQMAKARHKQHQTDAIAEKADGCRGGKSYGARQCAAAGERQSEI